MVQLRCYAIEKCGIFDLLSSEGTFSGTFELSAHGNKRNILRNPGSFSGP